MKLSKQILTLIVVSSTMAAVTTSCEKEDVRPNDHEKENPKCGFGEENGDDDTYCPACGMG